MAEDNPGVIVRPPLLYLGALLAATVVNWVFSTSFADVGISSGMVQITGGVILVIGIGIIAAAVFQFRKAGTNVPTNKPAEALVMVGIYKFTRNPIYVGLSSVYAGLSLLFDNPWALALLLPIMLTMHFGVIKREERYLEEKFGEPYIAYKQQVRRWL